MVFHKVGPWTRTLVSKQEAERALEPEQSSVNKGLKDERFNLDSICTMHVSKVRLDSCLRFLTEVLVLMWMLISIHISNYGCFFFYSFNLACSFIKICIRMFLYVFILLIQLFYHVYLFTFFIRLSIKCTHFFIIYFINLFVYLFVDLFSRLDNHLLGHCLHQLFHCLPQNKGDGGQGRV